MSLKKNGETGLKKETKGENEMKKKSLWLIIFFSVWVLLAILFAFLDLGISQKLYRPESNWAIVLENYGQIPGTLVGLLGMNVLLRLQKGKSWKSILAIIGLVIFILLSGFMVGGELQGQQSGQEASPVLSAIIGLALAAGMQVWFRLTPEATMQKYKTPALVVVFLILLSGFVTTWTLKILWGRWTYRDIVDAGNFALFTPWYLPQGPNGHNSFPSGHTNFALTVLPLLLLIPQKSKWNYPAWILVLIWGAVNGLSRIVVGAHFSSDVLFGAGQTILWFWLLSKRFVGKEKPA